MLQPQTVRIRLSRLIGFKHNCVLSLLKVVYTYYTFPVISLISERLKFCSHVRIFSPSPKFGPILFCITDT